MNKAPLAGWIVAMIAIAASVLLPIGTAGADTEPLFQFPQSELSIRTVDGRVLKFRIWTADNPSRQEQGLMFVRDMDDHAGMLFVFPTSQRVTMWMKNTYLSLDMLFLDRLGRIDYIAQRTTPLTLDLIQAPGPVTAVLELKGGVTQRLKIRAGDQVFAQDLGTANQ
ncbi:MAG: DUF192 domain-containing protein [Steroidobacterales bacterium]